MLASLVTDLNVAFAESNADGFDQRTRVFNLEVPGTRVYVAASSRAISHNSSEARSAYGDVVGILERKPWAARRDLVAYEIHFGDSLTELLGQLGQQGGHWVDFGGGEGDATREYYQGLSRNSDVYVTNVSYASEDDGILGPQGERYRVFKGRLLEEIPAEEIGSADVITDLAALGYSPAPDRTLVSLLSLLKPGGTLISSLGFNTEKHLEQSSVRLGSGEVVSLAKWIEQLPGLEVERRRRDLDWKEKQIAHRRRNMTQMEYTEHLVIRKGPDFDPESVPALTEVRRIDGTPMDYFFAEGQIPLAEIIEQLNPPDVPNIQSPDHHAIFDTNTKPYSEREKRREYFEWEVGTMSGQDIWAHLDTPRESAQALMKKRGADAPRFLGLGDLLASKQKAKIITDLSDGLMVGLNPTAYLNRLRNALTEGPQFSRESGTLYMGVSPETWQLIDDSILYHPGGHYGMDRIFSLSDRWRVEREDRMISVRQSNREFPEVHLVGFHTTPDGRRGPVFATTEVLDEAPDALFERSPVPELNAPPTPPPEPTPLQRLFDRFLD